jgi:hypothetical protein
MPLFKVTCRELIYVDRTYEIEAADAAKAENMIQKSGGHAGTLVDEQNYDPFSIIVLKVN